jgi:hypothetical protein
VRDREEKKNNPSHTHEYEFESEPFVGSGIELVGLDVVEQPVSYFGRRQGVPFAESDKQDVKTGFQKSNSNALVQTSGRRELGRFVAAVCSTHLRPLSSGRTAAVTECNSTISGGSYLRPRREASFVASGDGGKAVVSDGSNCTTTDTKESQLLERNESSTEKSTGGVPPTL